MASGLETDLYQLTMAAGYWRAGFTEPATFELFVRRLPARRSYLIACGLDPAIAFLEGIRFDARERDWLRRLPQLSRVPAGFFDEYLASFRFSGEVWAVPEGTPVFANEPILRVRAPIGEAQIVETALLSIVGFQTSVATKATRVVSAAAGRDVVEFGARRAHGLGAALDAARAAFVGGCAGSSYVEAARHLSIPTFGTMAHAWIQTFPDELDAFREFSRTFPDTAVYLLDTYDTLAAARHLAASGLRPPVVRLDSGDIVALSRDVRAILDAAGLTETRIFATGDLDEYTIAEIVGAGAPVDGFGVGTQLTTVGDAPSLSTVYKLVEVERSGTHVGVVKLSPGKETWPGPKQVWRIADGGTIVRDVIAGADEPAPPGGSPLLACVMREGRREEPPAELGVLRTRCRDAVRSLPHALHDLRRAAAFPVDVSPALDRQRSAAATTHSAQ
jgi:nicotinate phosphoribosyltransferase